MQLTPEALCRYPTVAQAACLICGLPFSSLDLCTIEKGIPAHPNYEQLETVALAIVEAIRHGDLRARTLCPETMRDLKVAEWLIHRDDLVDWLLLTHPDIQPEGLISPVTEEDERQQEVERLKRELVLANDNVALLQSEIALLKAKLGEESALQDGDTLDVRLLPKEAVASRTGINPKTLDMYVRDGRFPAADKRIGRRVYWLESTVDAFIKKAC